MGIGGQPVTIVVDVANVMGSRPDGWWRDRAGAAVRLHADIARLAAAAAPSCRTSPGARGDRGPNGRAFPGFVMVLEGAAKAAAARLAPPARAGRPGRAGHARPGAPPAARRTRTCGRAPGEVRVVQAAGSGDDAIVAVVRRLPGRRVVVTADRGLRERCVAAGAEIRGPGWLLGLLPRLSRTRCRRPGRQHCWSRGSVRATRPVQPGGPTSPCRPARWGAGARIVAVAKPHSPELGAYVRFGKSCENRLYWGYHPGPDAGTDDARASADRCPYCLVRLPAGRRGRPGHQDDQTQPPAPRRHPAARRRRGAGGGTAQTAEGGRTGQRRAHLGHADHPRRRHPPRRRARHQETPRSRVPTIWLSPRPDR